MNRNELLIAFRCDHYQNMTYENEPRRHRCNKLKTLCKGPCDEIETNEAGTDAIEFVEAYKNDGL